GFVVRMMADILKWKRDGDHVVERCCYVCMRIRDLKHMVDCPLTRPIRAGATQALIKLFSHIPAYAESCRRFDHSGDLRGVTTALELRRAVSPAADVAALVGAFPAKPTARALRRQGIQRDTVNSLITSARSILLAW